jgi:hypothetical protein
MVFALFVVAIGSGVVFAFVIVIKRFVITGFSPRETGALALMAFLLGIILEAYLAGDSAMEAFGSIVVLILAVYFVYLAIKRPWINRSPAQGGR